MPSAPSGPARAVSPASPLVLSALGLALAACGGKAPAAVARHTPVPGSSIGECGEIESAGVLSARPRLVRADRDLGGGPEAERVVADKALCDDAGNCQWNVFVPPRDDDRCLRYAGTLAASVLEPLATSGPSGMRDVRGYWTLASGRVLVQQYRFVRGGYRVVDALLCRSVGDDRLECAEQEMQP